MPLIGSRRTILSAHPKIAPNYNMPAGAVARWMASRGSTTGASVPSTNNTTSNSWASQVGGITATQSTPANTPTWLTGQFPSAIFGYDSGQSFDGSDDLMSFPSQNLGSANTLIATIKITNYGVIIGGSAGNYFLYTASNLVAYSTNTGTQNYIQVLNPLALNTIYTVGVRRNGANVEFTANSLTPGNWGSASNASLTTLSVDTLSSLEGFSLMSGCVFADISIYPSALSDFDYISGLTVQRQLYGAF